MADKDRWLNIIYISSSKDLSRFSLVANSQISNSSGIAARRNRSKVPLLLILVPFRVSLLHNKGYGIRYVQKTYLYTTSEMDIWIVQLFIAALIFTAITDYSNYKTLAVTYAYHSVQYMCHKRIDQGKPHTSPCGETTMLNRLI